MPEDQKPAPDPSLPPVTVQLEKRIADLEAKLNSPQNAEERKKLLDRIDLLEKRLAEAKQEEEAVDDEETPPPAAPKKKQEGKAGAFFWW